MTNILSQVTPLTKGLLWLTSSPVSVDKSFYKDVDYLLNGLLTATLKKSEATGSHVLITENFGQSFYVIVGNEATDGELKNYFELLKPVMKDDSNILLIDESGSFAKVQKLAPENIKSKIQVIQ
jgi:hypothetical protein